MPIIIDTPVSPARGTPCAMNVGLLNNLGDAGMEGIEREMARLLQLGSGSANVKFQLFSLPSIARGAKARARMKTTYHSLDILFESQLDGLFVTGAEPLAKDLRDEAFWPELSAVIDWAKSRTRSTIWSCLSAHAAVLHLDGIRRRPLSAKCCGVFDAIATGDHPLLAGTTKTLRVCHSRWNALDESELVKAGYDVLTRGSIGVDSFVRSFGSQFIFLQGHPEYDIGALGREARRDVARWRADPIRIPALPVSYFTPEDEAALRAYIARGHVDTAPPATNVLLPWHRDSSVALFRNWLTLLSEIKQADLTRERGKVHSRLTENSSLALASPG